MEGVIFRSAGAGAAAGGQRTERVDAECNTPLEDWTRGEPARERLVGAGNVEQPRA